MAMVRNGYGTKWLASSLTDFKAKINKSKINKYKINNNNKTNTKHEFNVKYERYKQDISKDRKLCLGKKL
jgi:hypothetical protein